MMGENAMDSVGALPLVLHDSLRPSIEYSSNFINTSGGGMSTSVSPRDSLSSTE